MPYYRNAFDNDGDSPCCETCKDLPIRDMLKNGLPRQEAKYIGTLFSIMSRDSCGLCELITAVVRRSWGLGSHPNEDLSKVECKLFAEACAFLRLPLSERSSEYGYRLCIDTTTKPDAIHRAQLAAGVYLPLEIQLLEEDADRLGQEPNFYGRRVGDTMDVGLVNRWMRQCEKGHGTDCEEVWWAKKKELPATFRVVDVVRMKVVTAPPNCRFVALSYSWGSDTNYTTNSRNLSQHQQPGLDRATLPSTIIDAIDLVKQLGEDYLWVDGLCILQGKEDEDLRDVKEQIGAMDLIYGTALLTIFAAGNGKAEAPLMGFRPKTRQINQHIKKIQGLHLAAPLASLNEAIARSFWNTRGWTYQERLLSRRGVFFTCDQIFFQCRRDVWCEDLVAENNQRKFMYPAKYGAGNSLEFPYGKSPTASHPYIERFMTVIEKYTSRNLTLKTDIINAVSAITTVFAKGFESKAGNEAFQFGMPLSQLEHALLWQPNESTLPSRRRRARPTNWKPEIPSFVTPSWSWAGWRGAVQYRILGYNNSYPEAAESLIHEWLLADEDGKLRELKMRQGPRCSVEGRPPRFEIASEPLPRDQEVPRGTLVFRTASAEFFIEKMDRQSSFGVTYSSPYYDVFSIRSPVFPAKSIGYVILPCSVSTSVPLEFLVLSRAGGGYDRQFYEDEDQKSYFGCLLNVMAVKRKWEIKEGEVKEEEELIGADEKKEEKVEDDARERYGIGVIFEGAWPKESEVKVVKLH